MTWTGSTRRERLPANWPTLRRSTFARDGWRCTWTDTDGRCGWTDPTGTTLDCDHITPGDDHRPDNLRTLCRPHHRTKSAREGVAARRALPGRNRPPSPHPGELPPCA